jgi:hypothetical protein
LDRRPAFLCGAFFHLKSLKMQQYRVINTETPNREVNEYLITDTINANGHQEITLSRSYDENWSSECRGEERIKIIDTGNEYVFPKKMFAGDVGYDSFAELFILLSYINKKGHMPLYEGRIEEIIPDKTFEI